MIALICLFGLRIKILCQICFLTWYMYNVHVLCNTNSTSTLFDRETQSGQQDPAFTCDLRVTIRDRSLKATSCHNLSQLVTNCHNLSQLGSILSQLVRSRASVLRHGIARGWSSHEELEKAIMLMISLRSTDDNCRINGRFSD